MDDSDQLFEARALLFQFIRSSLKAIHVASPGLEFACTRDAAISLSSLTRTRAAKSGRSTELESADHLETIVRMPHLATVEWLAQVGSVVRKGDAVARLRLLDESIELKSEVAGAVVSHHARSGTLVEFDKPLICLS